MNVEKLLLYAQKYYGTKTKGEEYRQKEIAKWVADVIRENEELEAHLNSGQYRIIHTWVNVDVPE
jgi:hypothetical protein